MTDNDSTIDTAKDIINGFYAAYLQDQIQIAVSGFRETSSGLDHATVPGASAAVMDPNHPPVLVFSGITSLSLVSVLNHVRSSVVLFLRTSIQLSMHAYLKGRAGHAGSRYCANATPPKLETMTTFQTQSHMPRPEKRMQADLPLELHSDAFTGAAGDEFALEWLIP